MKMTRQYAWIKDVNQYLKEKNLTHREIKIMKKEEIKKTVNDWDTKKWRNDMENNSSIDIYRKWKIDLKKKGK